MTASHEQAESLEKAIGHLQAAVEELKYSLGEQVSDLRGKVEVLTDELKEFAEQVEDTIYRMNRDREGYDDYD